MLVEGAMVVMVDELRYLGVAFNDCSVISFPLGCGEGDCVGGEEKGNKEMAGSSGGVDCIGRCREKWGIDEDCNTCIQ